MAITVHTLNRPWIWAEAVPGGTLTPATYYFIGFFCFAEGLSSGSYYGYAPSNASEQVSVVTDAVNNRIKLEVYEFGGHVTAYADKGDSIHVTVTSSAHGMGNGDTAYLRGTVNYKGSYIVSGVTANTFDIVATWVTNDGASNWYKTPGLPSKPTNYAGDVYFFYKWDYCTMLRADGSYVQWLNTNDSAAGITAEWYHATLGYYGHRRWIGAYYYAGLPENNFTAGADSSRYLLLGSVSVTTTSPAPSTTIMYEGSGGSSICGFVVHPQISLRKYIDASATLRGFQLPDGMEEDSPAALILVDNSDTNNTWYYMATALDAYTGNSIIVTRNASIAGITSYQAARDVLLIRGVISFQAVSSWTLQPTWYDKNIILVHGRIAKASGMINSATVPKLVGCVIWYSPLNGSYWVQPNINAPNSTIISNGANLILDTVYTDNTIVAAPLAFVNYYVSNDGTNFLGTLAKKTNYSQVMRNGITGQYVRNSTFTWTACLKDVGHTDGRIFEMTNVEFKQPQSDAANSATGDYNFDFICPLTGATASSVINDIYNWTNCSSPDRADKTIRIKYGAVGVSSFPVAANSTAIHNFFYDIEFLVTDQKGTPIIGAVVSIINSKLVPDVYSGATNSSGYVKLTPKCYDIVIDPNNADGYICGYGGNKPFWSKTTLFNSLTISIKASGFEPYSSKLLGVLTAHSLIVSLKRSCIAIDQEARL